LEISKQFRFGSKQIRFGLLFLSSWCSIRSEDAPLWFIAPFNN